MSHKRETPINDKRTINGWAMFDWANSVYSLVISTAIFPVYFLQITNDTVEVLGTQISNSALLAYSISAAYLALAAVSPALSGIADYGGKKKYFLQIFSIIGSIACMAMYFFRDAGDVYFGTTTYIFATIGYAGAIVFYNAYLPEITTPDRYDEVSARGFAFGYVGSVLLLLINLFMIEKYEIFGFDSKGKAIQIAFLMVGLWWISFAQVSFRRLPKDTPIGKSKDLLGKGFEELKKVWRELQHQVFTKRFLASFFCYSAGAQTVFFLATAFAEKELDLTSSQLIITILIVQLVGLVGAYIFAHVSKLRGNKFSILCILIIWMIVCALAFFVQTLVQFYTIAGLVGLVMGGTQSMSRSTYSKLLPENTEDTASYFSFYDVLEKLAIVVGTFGFGLIESLTDSMRNSVLMLTIFFIAGIVFLLRVKVVAGEVRS